MLLAIGGKSTMDDRDDEILQALAWMVDQYLSRGDGSLDNDAMSAGELAMEVLANRSLVELENSRIGRWTQAGRDFLAVD
ncbi:hypothetical protein [Methylorubrum sp. SB2]|uniref:hypothetical protein n=1 Tax=Methylorubrum subtropicum TaxID=3138812 RepID=UPI00313D50E9